MNKVLKITLSILLSVLCLGCVATGIASCKNKEDPSVPPTSDSSSTPPTTEKPSDSKVPVYRIEYVADGVTVGFDDYIHAGSELVPPEIPPKDGYTSRWEDFSIEGEGDIIVHAIYTPIEYTISYEVVYISNGEVEHNYRGDWETWKSTYTVLSKYNFPETYTVESEDIKLSALPEIFFPNNGGSEEFSSWYLDEQCTQKFDGVIETGSTGDLKLYAKFAAAWTGFY